MHIYYQVKDMLHKELEDIIREGGSDIPLDIVDKLLNSIKNSCKIIMYEEYSDDDYSYDGGYSNARGVRAVDIPTREDILIAEAVTPVMVAIPTEEADIPTQMGKKRRSRCLKR